MQRLARKSTKQTQEFRYTTDLSLQSPRFDDILSINTTIPLSLFTITLKRQKPVRGMS